MARKRKSKDRTPVNKTVQKSDQGQASKTRNRGKEAISRKRKAVSETPRRRSKRLKSNRLNSSSSVELIRVLPCCSSAQERKKFAKLGLDSALFFSNSKPAKRKQSHISVVTISSSDDEDLNNEKTADWISKIDLKTIDISRAEEPFPSGDADFSQNDDMTEEILDAEKFRPQKSSTQVCSTPESSFKPLNASTPNFQPPYLSRPEAEEGNLLVYKGPSFLENPIKHLRHQLNTLKINESVHSAILTEQNHGDDEYTDKSVLNSKFSCSPNFYFGPSENLKNLQQILENSESTAPMWSDLCYFSSGPTSNTNVNTLDKDFARSETEGDRYSVEQVPSTSNAPVSHPILEVAPKKKRSKSRKNSTSKS